MIIENMSDKTNIKPLLDSLMVQEQIKNSWEHMVAVITLNQTYRKTVKRVLPEFLCHFNDADTLLKADVELIKQIIKPLGLVNTRCNRLINMSKDYLGWDGVDAKKLYGIGKYGSDSYEIFFKNNCNVQPTDKELIRYLEEKQ
jgi:methyl-CpG-binding domain protein 4